MKSIFHLLWDAGQQIQVIKRIYLYLLKRSGQYKLYFFHKTARAIPLRKSTHEPLQRVQKMLFCASASYNDAV